jgi:hypothetical protein
MLVSQKLNKNENNGSTLSTFFSLSKSKAQILEQKDLLSQTFPRSLAAINGEKNKQFLSTGRFHVFI